MSEYYIIRNNSPAGPFTLKELAAMAITPDTMVWAEDIVDWKPAYQVSELNYLFASTTAQTPPPYQEPSSRATEAPRYDTAGLVDWPSARPPMPPTYLVWSILVTIFLSRIIGIIAIVYSIQVSSYYHAGNYEGAAYASRQARRWVRVPAFIYLGLFLAFLIGGLIGWLTNG
ncbi:CD225/dispanin family protein [uncultured Porphyromonas sp.]|uniref:CD225/dispanin family protein n=1 Tax=uncultured Porphyromonas sp. TaxID=159274 RepID=UPI00262B64D7|nr:CD225/dispanin family protein [uncultured Porphyromonas sp.]